MPTATTSSLPRSPPQSAVQPKSTIRSTCGCQARSIQRGYCGRGPSAPVAARRGDFVELQANTRVFAAICPCPDDLFGSSQYDPSAIRLRVRNPSSTDGEAVSRYVVTSPAPRTAGESRSVVGVDIPDRLV